MHSYDAIPFAPPGWRVLIFKDPTKSGSWDPHGVEAFSSGGRLIFTIFSCEGGTSSFIYLGNRVETGRKSGMNLA